MNKIFQLSGKVKKMEETVKSYIRIRPSIKGDEKALVKLSTSSIVKNSSQEEYIFSKFKNLNFQKKFKKKFNFLNFSQSFSRRE